MQERCSNSSFAQEGRSEYDETWATARLPNLDVDLLHRRAWDGAAEQLLVTVRTVPAVEAFSRMLELSNPLVVWTRMMDAAWCAWMSGPAAALSKTPLGRRRSGS